MGETTQTVVRPDAPERDEFEPGATVSVIGSRLWDVVAVDYDGSRYCLDCATPAYVEKCKQHPEAIRAGGPVGRGNLMDVDHAYACDHCGRTIEP